jgi:hypothetical protein
VDGPEGDEVTERLIDPDCAAGKCGSCVGGPCEHDCHDQDRVPEPYGMLQPGEREVTLTHRIGTPAVDGNWFGGRPDAPLTWPDPTLPPAALPARASLDAARGDCGGWHLGPCGTGRPGCDAPIAAESLPPGALPARQLDTGPRVVKLDQDATAADVAALAAHVGRPMQAWQHHALAQAGTSYTWGGHTPPAAAEQGPRPWRLGESWAAHDGELVTVVEVGTGEPDAAGRRADDRLVGALLRADAELVVDLRRQLAAAEDALHRIATSPARCMDEDCEAPRVIASEALAGDPPADQAAELDVCTICGGRLDDDPPAGSPCADGHDARDPVGTIPAGALAVGDRVRITTGGVVDVERDDAGTGETD